MKKNLVEFSHVSFGYSKELAVDDVSFTIGEGDFIGLIGQNGSGKTTLLKLMTGLLEPQRGTISRLKRYTIGYVPQKSAQSERQFPLTCEELVLQGRVAKAGLFRMLAKKDRSKAREALFMVGMLDKKDYLVRELSGGQQQKIFIARALAADPKLLILDEPTVGIDEASQEEFYALLGKLRREQDIAIIIVSHDMEVVMREVITVLCMNKKLVYHGSPEKFVEGKTFIHHEH